MATAAAPTVEPANASAEKNINNLEQGFGGSGPAGGASEVAATKHDSLRTRIWKHLDGEVNPEACTYQMIGYCFITGWIDAISFAAAFIFCGFQTGNVVQLAAALARLFSGPYQSSYFFYADRLALTSLCSFLLGSSLGQLGDRIGPKKRLWLMGATFLQAGMMMASFICVLVSNQVSVAEDRQNVSWTSGLGFLALAFASGSMGLQAICGKRLNTHYGTTVVLTTIWCEFIADPGLLHWRHRVPSRDHRLTAVMALFIGAFVGRILVNEIGGAATFGIGALIKTILAATFWWVPTKIVKKT